MAIKLRFRSGSFVREGGGISFEERPAQPGDFTAARGFVYAEKYADSPTEFPYDYPSWQSFADCFVMRRPVVTVSGSQRCDTQEFKASELGDYTDPGFVEVKNFRVPGSDRSSIPDGKYQMTSLSFRDCGNGHTDVSVTYQRYGKWKLIQLIKTPPDPAAGAAT